MSLLLPSQAKTHSTSLTALLQDLAMASGWVAPEPYDHEGALCTSEMLPACETKLQQSQTP